MQIYSIASTISIKTTLVDAKTARKKILLFFIAMWIRDKYTRVCPSETVHV